MVAASKTRRIFTCSLTKVGHPDGVNWADEMGEGKKMIEFRKFSNNQLVLTKGRARDKLLLIKSGKVHSVGRE